MADRVGPAHDWLRVPCTTSPVPYPSTDMQRNKTLSTRKTALGPDSNCNYRRCTTPTAFCSPVASVDAHIRRKAPSLNLDCEKEERGSDVREVSGTPSTGCITAVLELEARHSSSRRGSYPFELSLVAVAERTSRGDGLRPIRRSTWANAGPIGLSTTGPISIKRWSSVISRSIPHHRQDLIVAECRPSATAVVFADEIEVWKPTPPIRQTSSDLEIADTWIRPSSSWEGVSSSALDSSSGYEFELRLVLALETPRSKPRRCPL